MTDVLSSRVRRITGNAVAALLLASAIGSSSTSHAVEPGQLVWRKVSTTVDPAGGVLVGCVNDACTGSISDGSFDLAFVAGQDNQSFQVTFETPPGEIDPADPPTLASSGAAGGSGNTPFRITFCYRIDDVAPAPGVAEAECTIIANNVNDVPESDSGEFPFAPRVPQAAGEELVLFARVNFWGAVEYVYESVVAEDVPRCKGQPATIVVDNKNTGERVVGTEGDDVILGSPFLDFIDGRGGNDTICGGDGADVIKGGAGNDKIYGQGGIDVLRGNGGHDILRAGRGHSIRFRNALYGGPGRDLLFGSGSRDRLFGGPGADRLFGGGDSDVILGGHGRDQAFGGRGTDFIGGGVGAEILEGGPKFDYICGGAGNDDIYGGTGMDDVCDFDMEDLSPPSCERIETDRACEAVRTRSPVEEQTQSSALP